MKGELSSGRGTSGPSVDSATTATGADPAALTAADGRQWFWDDEFETPLPPSVAEECARVYGRGRIGVDFAQSLAAFLAIRESAAILTEALATCTPADGASSRRLSDDSAGGEGKRPWYLNIPIEM